MAWTSSNSAQEDEAGGLKFKANLGTLVKTSIKVKKKKKKQKRALPRMHGVLGLIPRTRLDERLSM